ncbi:patatin-like phospholipase family protein [Klebsiella quasipneumoniae subsp. similipneumoniae]|uniref:patatin-like phospholipase family protein n=1 Tax=Klebsiella quasipneumoniae TaxID=1463165 RepID=UPI0010E31DB0|nr:patatin-like phospholipase family protein [Klebsiella quasipneumoniae]UDC51469.1 patatin-like phospholipase family protein [Klebsiella quasipneumoniae subsp. similipneumoniae]VGP21714.1 hypothetical protein SB00610_01417 [Klebsiella quasipneumoniae subsp. similipneumoniae]
MSDENDSSLTIATHCAKRRENFPDDVKKTFSTRPWGIALSGGGIRSATFSFGLLKALSKNKIFHRFDILSTVSGGGYIGSTIGKLFHGTKDPFAVEEALSEADTRWFAVWLRANGRYLIPGGMQDVIFATANFGRNILAIHLELACLSILLGSIIVSIDLLAWGLADNIYAQRDSLRIASPLITILGFVSQWPTIWLLLIPLLFFSLVLSCAYWALPTQNKESFSIGMQSYLTLLLAFSGAFIILCQFTHTLDNTIINNLAGWLKIPAELGYVLLTICMVYFFGVLVAVILNACRKDKNLDWARNKLTTGLSLVLRIALVITVIGGTDYLAWSLGNSNSNIQGTLGAVLGLIAVAFRIALPKISDLPKSLITVTRRVVLEVINFIGILGLALIVIFWMSLVHRLTSNALFDMSLKNLTFSAAWQVLSYLFFPTLLIVVISSRNQEFLNRSSLYTFYRARLIRSYLGAGNPQRFKSTANTQANCLSPVENNGLFTNVTDVQPQDDIPMQQYQPHHSGGPVHLINVCVNQTRDAKGGLFNQDRKGILMTVGPKAQVSISKNKWYQCASNTALSLCSWMAISGAAVAPGLGASTRPGISALLMMSGIRLGYWWDSSNITSNSDSKKNNPGKYKQLLNELCGRFDINSRRDWFLSDGGHFENTGAYALLREECEIIIVADCSADPRYSFGDLENLVRKARIDLQVQITFLRPKQPYPNLPGVFGSLNELASSESEACLAIARINYMHSNTTGYMFIVKPNMCQQAPIDLVNFKAENPLFPQEPTTDQFFSEAQWESYFQLGQTIGNNITLTQLTNAAVFADTYFIDDDGAIIIKTPNGKQSLQYSTKRLSSRIVATGAVSASISLGAFASIGLAGWQAISSAMNNQSQDSFVKSADLKELSDIFGSLPVSESNTPDLSGNKIGQMATALLRVGDSACSSKNFSEFKKSNFLNFILKNTREACKTSNSSHPSCKELLNESNFSPCLQQNPRATCQHMYWTRDYSLSSELNIPNCMPVIPLSDISSSTAISASGKVGDIYSVKTHNITHNTSDFKCKGITIYLQIYGPEWRDAARMYRKPWREMGASVPPIEDVVDTARRDGRRPPQPYPVPTVIYHNATARSCALALQPPGTEPRWQIHALPNKLDAVQGVIEVWLPPSAFKVEHLTDNGL